MFHEIKTFRISMLLAVFMAVGPYFTGGMASAALHSTSSGSGDHWLNESSIFRGVLLAGNDDDRESPFSASPAGANRAERILNQGQAECGALSEEYRISCLSGVFDEAARVLSGGEFAAAKRELQTASRQLASIAQANADPAAPPVSKGRTRITAVKKNAVRSTNQQARQVISETETRLIRSAGSSAARKTHYQRIANAVGSTKRILRS